MSKAQRWCVEVVTKQGGKTVDRFTVCHRTKQQAQRDARLSRKRTVTRVFREKI